MNRGKIIGAIVLIVAVGLIIVQLSGGPEEANSDAISAGPDADVLAQADTAAGDGVVAQAADTGTRIYTVDAAGSEVYWRIYKAGLMARFGHNHVISVGDLEGSIAHAGDPSASEWTLSFRVAELNIDDPDIRARYGEDFESVPSEDDIAGTRSNMLTPDVLDGEVYPAISLSGSGFGGTPGNARIPVSIALLGRTIEQEFPAAIEISDDEITISGEYRLTHEDLGMTPFKALGGALSVADEFDFSYRIRAVAGGR